TIDCLGNVDVSPFATLPQVGTGGQEKYLTIAPSQSAMAVPQPFTPRDVFVTQGVNIYKISGGAVTWFAGITCDQPDHTGITFDHVGTFDYNMIVTCFSGAVYKVDGSGTVTHIADTNRDGGTAEGPAVVPSDFGPYGGQIWVADDTNSTVNAIAPDGTVTYDVVIVFSAEGVHVIPSTPCAYCSGGAFFQAIEDSNSIYQYPPTDFTGLGGNILVTSEE